MSFLDKDKSRSQKPFQLLGIKFAPLSIPFERRLQTIAALIWSSIIVIGFPLGYILFLYLLWTSRAQWIFWPYIAWLIYDIRTPFNGGRNIHGSICLNVRNWRIWKYFKDYFPVKVIKTTDLDPNKGYLLGSHPHGFMASGVFAAFGTNDKDLIDIYPNIKSRVIATSGIFIIPFIRELNTSFGSVSCSKESMEIALRNGKGLIHVLIVGGAMEAMNLGDHKDVHTLYLEKRKGFIKMAIRTGVDLIPSFTFGENKLYHQFEHPLLKKIQLFFERIFGFVPLIFFGRGIFQYSFGFLPLRVPLHVVIGKPIPVIMDPNPSIEMIENLHRIYVNDLKELYDKYNPLYGDANVKLVIS
ncbi:2-acylglycerol O-acyltransferase 1 isoform X2 [Lepeophtheirus salmonis]|uniref:2-acylglycerol O-acyltransferase 1 isoform X2 n=1 Tax=Lepeophtheirus salmonis TaxID=72036 RepID=UPI001AE9DBA8|nr:2-acylglycerol O-acyltransferase 1-like isoform X2 [Lepeophtheirus salmonis]